MRRGETIPSGPRTCSAIGSVKPAACDTGWRSLDTVAAWLAACSKGGAGGNNGDASGGSQQLSWDQGNWNQTSWQ